MQFSTQGVALSAEWLKSSWPLRLPPPTPALTAGALELLRPTKQIAVRVEEAIANPCLASRDLVCYNDQGSPPV